MNRKKTLALDYLITFLAALSYLFYFYTYNFIFLLASLVLVVFRVFIFIPRYGHYYLRSISLLERIIMAIIVPFILLTQANEHVSVAIRLILFAIGVLGYSAYYLYLIKKKSI